MKEDISEILLRLKWCGHGLHGPRYGVVQPQLDQAQLARMRINKRHFANWRICKHPKIAQRAASHEKLSLHGLISFQEKYQELMKSYPPLMYLKIELELKPGKQDLSISID